MQNGALEVELLKREHAKPRKIEVQMADPATGDKTSTLLPAPPLFHVGRGRAREMTLRTCYYLNKPFSWFNGLEDGCAFPLPPPLSRLPSAPPLLPISRPTSRCAA
jgi:hypothetical protein